MKAKLIILCLVSQMIVIQAQMIPQDDFLIIDKKLNVTFELGVPFSNVMDIYPDLTFIGEKKYTNIAYNRYKYDNIIFSISVYAKNEREARVRVIEVYSVRYATKRGVTIGSTKEEVVKLYGNPDRLRGSRLVYINNEYDQMEIIFDFDSNNRVNYIELVTGT